MLVVMCIMALLIALIAPAITTLASTSLTTAAAELRNAAEQARQTAEASGYPVELRVYEPTGGQAGYYTAFRLVKIYETTNQINGTTNQYLPLRQLPQGIVITTAADASSILKTAPAGNEAPTGYNSAATRSIRFSPLGSIQGLSSTSPQTLSLVQSLSPVVANGLPRNFATITFDPVLGSTAIYRP